MKNNNNNKSLSSSTPHDSPIPRKLNQGMIDALSLAIAKGNYYCTASALCDIDEHTLGIWVELGLEEERREEPDTENLYLRLTASLKKAEAEAEARRVERIEAAGIGGALVRRRTITQRNGDVIEDEQYASPQWLADMTHLERRHPDRWGRRERKQIDINEHKQITITRVEVVLDQGSQPAVIEGESRELLEGKA